MTTRILHLSDLHIATTASSRKIRKALPRAISAYARSAGRGAFASIWVTGDVFDTSDFDRTEAMTWFLEFVDDLWAALGAPTPMVIIPGNHDRRRSGVVGPHDPGLFEALGRAATTRPEAPIFVAGRAPHRAEFVPPEAHAVAATVATFDSTVLLRGHFSAGGEIRQEDLLYLLTSLPNGAPASPLVLLMHHHLIPTPLTDIGRIETRRMDWVERLAVRRVIPWLISNADHEELTMTALGAGTAISSLHGIDRPVLVVHGHKHYPTARVLVGTGANENDVVIVSAGSAGVAEPWSPTGGHDIGHLWPSFNVLEFEADGSLVATSVAFSPANGRLAPGRTLVSVSRNGLRWGVRSPAASPSPAPELAQNDAHFVLSHDGDPKRWALTCRRTLVANPAGPPVEQVEVVEGAPGAMGRDVVDVSGTRPSEAVPFRLKVSTQSVASYTVLGGLCRTRETAAQLYGDGTAFEWVGLVNRAPSASASLRLHGLPPANAAFGSITDMATGRERVAELVHAEGGWRLDCSPCPARSLLRIYVVL